MVRRMTSLAETGILQEMNCMQNKAYVLNNNNDFFLTGYRVLQGQDKNCFVKCARVLYNGQIKLIYFSAEYTSLADILSQLNADNFINIMANILSAVLEVQGNGFLYCPNIAMSPDSIFVETNTLAVKLIYLPINMLCNHKSVAEFENDLKTMLIRLIQTYPQFSSNSKISAVSKELFNGALSIHDLYKCIRCKTNGSYHKPFEKSEMLQQPKESESFFDKKPTGQPPMTLKTISLLYPHQFNISKPKFSIGRNEKLDGVVNFSKAVSRYHCEIVYDNFRYYVIDPGSTHGTYIKHKFADHYSPRLPIEDRQELQNGDCLKLADVEFSVSF